MCPGSTVGIRRTRTPPDRHTSIPLSNNNGSGVAADVPLSAITVASTAITSSRRIDNGSVRVVVRCRPMNAVEKARGDQHLFRFTPKQTQELQVVSSSGPGRELVRCFQFDFCASEEHSQTHFFRTCGVIPLLESVTEGYLATVFAYGQTGSGKTYSMSGMEELLAVAGKKSAVSTSNGGPVSGSDMQLSDGIIPRALHYLYTLFERAPKEVKFVVRASYCEIYNEQVFDLLNPSSGSLNVRWTDRNGFYVQNLLVVQCDSIDDMHAVVQEGHKNRRVGTHEMNKDSSRSHSILSIHVDRETTDPNDGHVVVKYGKISFVDLAGSERLKETKSSNAEETSNINKSLLTLGKVISALASKTNVNFIPYRDSKLTKLLMDSLGGNSLALMIACVSPSVNSLEDTLSTLNYATRAKNIQNKPTIQVDPMELMLSNLRKENHMLKEENEALRLRLRALGAGGGKLDRSSLLPLLASHNQSEEFQQHNSLLRSSSSRFLPPLASDPFQPQQRSPSKEKKPTISPSKTNTTSSPTRGTLDAYKNQLSVLQEENEKLIRHSTATNQRLQDLKAENAALQQRLNQVHTAADHPTNANSSLEQYKHQILHLQQREQELMQALSRRSRGNRDNYL